MSIELNETTKLYETTIDEHLYEFAKWGAESAMETLYDLSTVLGEPLSAAMLEASAGSDASLAGKTMAQAMPKIAAHLSRAMGPNRELALALIKRLATRSVQCDHRDLPPYDLHYKGRLPHLFKVVSAALEVQFGGFFAVMQDVSGLRVVPASPPTAAASPSPQTSTG